MNVLSHPNTINYCCNKLVTMYSQFLLYHFLLGIVKSIKPNKCQALNSSLRFCIPTATETILHPRPPPDIHSYVQAIRSHVVNPTRKKDCWQTSHSFILTADSSSGIGNVHYKSVLIHLELKTINFCQALDSETSTKNSYLIPSPQPAVLALYLVRVLYPVRIFQSAFYT